MKKTFEFNKIDFNKTGRKINLVTVEIELKENDKGQLCYSSSAEVWNNIKSDCIAGGQCLDSILPFKKHNKLYCELYRLWTLYHLNNMHVGTIEQDNAINEYLKDGKRYDYTSVCEYLKSVGLYEVMNNGQLYKYGHSWLYRSIPDNDLKIIKELLNHE